MKKNIMISLSVIFALMILLLPSNKINAEVIGTININYSDFQSRYDKFSSNLQIVKDYLDTYDNIYYFIGVSNSNFYVYVFEKNDCFLSYVYGSNEFLQFRFTKQPSCESNKMINISNITLNNFETKFLTLKSSLENNNFTIESSTRVISMTFYNNTVDLSLSSMLYATNYENLYLSDTSSFNYNVNNVLIDIGGIFPTYFDITHISYENYIELSPSEYNYFYIKFKGVGDLSFFYNQNIITNEELNKNVYYEMYNNNNYFKTMLFVSGGDYSISEYFSNVTDKDIFTLIFPIYTYNFDEEDIYTLNFTIPGLIEYGTNEFKYIFQDGEWVLSETDRSDVTDLLEPSENEPDEIVSSGTSHNTLTNNSLNEFMWPYSLFARNGNNINNVSLTGFYSSTNSFNLNDFKTDLIINYGEEKYKININNCISLGNCNLTRFEQDMIKNILFDRNVENSTYYLDFSVIPQKDIVLSGSDQFNFGISINFNSSVELTINSMLLAINELSNSYYNVYFKLYDSSGQVHTIYKTSLDNNYIGVNQFQLDSRTADIYRVDLMFVYNHTLSTISTTDKYSLKFSEFNIFANTEMIHIYTDNTNVTYQTCSWYDLFCHGQNLFTWLTYEAPGSSDFWSIFLYITNIFDILWVIITYIFMPFDIIPPIFGIPMSTILPFLLVVLALIKKIWFGGGD